MNDYQQVRNDNPQPNYRQSLLRNFMQNPNAAMNNAPPPQYMAQNNMSSQGSAMPPQLSEAMKLYFANKAQPSAYNQGLPQVTANQSQKGPPTFDATSLYDDLLYKYGATERGINGSSIYSQISNNIIDLPDADKLNYLTAWMNGNKKDSWMPLRQSQYDLLNSGLNDINKQRDEWNKAHPVTVSS